MTSLSFQGRCRFNSNAVSAEKEKFEEAHSARALKNCPAGYEASGFPLFLMYGMFLL